MFSTKYDFGKKYIPKPYDQEIVFSPKFTHLKLEERILMLVIKASGEKEEYQPEKIRRTCLRSGATKSIADKVVKEVTGRVYEGISTQEILRLTLGFLEKEKPEVATRYDLKGAIMRLGPAGFPFETFIGELLREYGYQIKLRTIVSGACVNHEIDIIADEVSGSKINHYMIECKYHNTVGIYTGLKDVLYTYARYLDLVEGWKAGKCERFDGAWLVCNTKASLEAIQYAECKGLKLLCWKYPKNDSLIELIERKKLYPISILRTIDKSSLINFHKANLMLAKDLLKYELKDLERKTHVPREKLQDMLEETKKLFLLETEKSTQFSSKSVGVYGKRIY